MSNKKYDDKFKMKVVNEYEYLYKLNIISPFYYNIFMVNIPYNQ
jgi:hypothetical protein